MMLFGSKAVKAILTKLIGELERYKTFLPHLFRDDGHIAKSKVKFTAIKRGVGE